MCVIHDYILYIYSEEMHPQATGSRALPHRLFGDSNGMLLVPCWAAKPTAN